jgi:hypothetical protein
VTANWVDSNCKANGIDRGLGRPVEIGDVANLDLVQDPSVKFLREDLPT